MNVNNNKTVLVTDTSAAPRAQFLDVSKHLLWSLGLCQVFLYNKNEALHKSKEKGNNPLRF